MKTKGKRRNNKESTYEVKAISQNSVSRSQKFYFCLHRICVYVCVCLRTMLNTCTCTHVFYICSYYIFIYIFIVLVRPRRTIFKVNILCKWLFYELRSRDKTRDRMRLFLWMSGSEIQHEEHGIKSPQIVWRNQM